MNLLFTQICSCSDSSYWRQLGELWTPGSPTSFQLPLDESQHRTLTLTVSEPSLHQQRFHRPWWKNIINIIIIKFPQTFLTNMNPAPNLKHQNFSLFIEINVESGSFFFLKILRLLRSVELFFKVNDELFGLIALDGHFTGCTGTLTSQRDSGRDTVEG